MFREGWRGFNYLFLVVFPPEREAEVSNLLGPWNDLTWANQHALEIANAEVQTLSDNEGFLPGLTKEPAMSLYNSILRLQKPMIWDSSVYARLDQNEKTRPYRIMWYQTGPYWAYYYSGRYQDVIDLANTTLNETIADPTLEEKSLLAGTGAVCAWRFRKRHCRSPGSGAPQPELRARHHQTSGMGCQQIMIELVDCGDLLHLDECFGL